MKRYAMHVPPYSGSVRPEPDDRGKWFHQSDVVALLSSIEWVEHDSTCIERCPFCGHSKQVGHDLYCAIKNILEDK